MAPRPIAAVRAGLQRRSVRHRQLLQEGLPSSDGFVMWSGVAAGAATANALLYAAKNSRYRAVQYAICGLFLGIVRWLSGRLELEERLRRCCIALLDRVFGTGGDDNLENLSKDLDAATTAPSARRTGASSAVSRKSANKLNRCCNNGGSNRVVSRSTEGGIRAPDRSTKPQTSKKAANQKESTCTGRRNSAAGGSGERHQQNKLRPRAKDPTVENANSSGDGGLVRAQVKPTHADTTCHLNSEAQETQAQVDIAKIGTDPDTPGHAEDHPIEPASDHCRESDTSPRDCCAVSSAGNSSASCDGKTAQPPDQDLDEPPKLLKRSWSDSDIPRLAQAQAEMRTPPDAEAGAALPSTPGAAPAGSDGAGPINSEGGLQQAGGQPRGSPWLVDASDLAAAWEAARAAQAQAEALQAMMFPALDRSTYLGEQYFD
mmetsp:Transcript_90975/g.266386  ORF Transcript_90975/g.266386 Transcript_90975/m.266386 type:complete len:431 (+) Transcript_90975:60-1352(+)